MSELKFELPERGKPDAQVPCGTCKLCCQGKTAVLIMPEYGDDASTYETTDRPVPDFPPMEDVLFLKFKPNGDCFYLGDNGCTIHGRAPYMCRIFDCREQHKMYTKKQREELSKKSIIDGKILRRGAILLHQQGKTK